MIKSFFGILALLCLTPYAVAEPAQWIEAGSGSPPQAVTHYRLSLPMKAKPDQFIIQVTADAIYRLYINGKSVASGPTSGDLKKWRYERIDVASHLVEGPNLLAAVVWYPVQWNGPMCMMGSAPGFFMQGESNSSVNTGSANWKTYGNSEYSPYKKNNTVPYFALGDFEQIDGQKYPWGWETAAFDDSNWSKPAPSARTCTLIPRDIPMLEVRQERLVKIRKSEGVAITEAFLAGKTPVVIPPKTKATILMDREELTNAYPELVLNGGKGALVDIGYAEALYVDHRVKGDRSVIENKVFKGVYDRIIVEGGTNRHYRPLWFRTYRYIQLDIQTADEPLVLVDFFGEFTGYPFKELATFEAGDAQLKRIWDVGWRTLRLCAVENFYDCPYYERLQYIGDTRIQALISVYVSGDDRLMRKAVDLFKDSLGGEGLTSSRYPSKRRQIIPTFSNWWIAMVDDYRMLNGDKEFIRSMVPGIEKILERFEKFTDSSNLVTSSNKGEWDFVDWSAHLAHGEEKKTGERRPLGILSLNHVYALDRAANIMGYLGESKNAEAYRARSKRIRDAVYASCWNKELGILADDPAQKLYTEHSNILGILTDAIPPEQQKAVMQKILEGKPKMARATIYFRFYYNRALIKTGLAEKYLETLGLWHDQLKLNLTTWAEQPEPSRSDCHAWGASPNYEFLATVAGITPAAPRFAQVRIAPALGPLKSIDVKMPHAKGMILVKLSKSESGISGRITLPDDLNGNFEWGGNVIPLKPGEQGIDIK